MENRARRMAKQKERMGNIKEVLMQNWGYLLLILTWISLSALVWYGRITQTDVLLSAIYGVGTMVFIIGISHK